MPSVDLYLNPVDGPLLLDWLNSGDEVAFVLANEGTAPRLTKNLPSLPPGDYFLFHKSYPSIPTYRPRSKDDQSATEELYSLMKVQPPAPQSGVDLGHPAIFRICIRYTLRLANQNLIGLSHIAWIGNRYASEGLAASPESKRWWRRFNAWIARNARKISRSGPLDDIPKNSGVWAFPSALKSISTGTPRADNHS
jgi:hypothetical protein